MTQRIRWLDLPRCFWRRRSIQQTVTVGIVYALILTASALASLSATLPSNVVWERTQLPTVRAALNTIAAQDFAFFTRSPEADQIDAYRLNSDGTLGVSLLVTPQTKVTNFFGLSRTQRAQGPELANLVRAVPGDAWADCTGLDRAMCMDAIPRQKASLSNDSLVPTVCGQVALTIESIVKWAYRRLTEDGYTIERVAQADVDCTHAH
ncbi:SdpA family antimicrobial peptide system protein [Mycobacterium sp. E3247]|uniref:SdpA family antimicrobial peptide system protein n=1 Tax=Mycobacterium sp. E3247 TaxID=1856864 RepID=UPI0009ED0CDB|nr:SdpA family antimicrobial peptide system protein [Mycobacterium sp. E3247]